MLKHITSSSSSRGQLVVGVIYCGIAHGHEDRACGHKFTWGTKIRACVYFRAGGKYLV